MSNKDYTTQLQAGLGMIEETMTLLGLWKPKMNTRELFQVALDSGLFPSLSARRLRNIVAECFAPRYLTNSITPASLLQPLSLMLNKTELIQLLFLYTCRANSILADFMRVVFWPAYSSGREQISNDEARAFVKESNQTGKMASHWSEGTIRRVGAYLTGICSDFGLLESGSRSVRRIISQSIHRTTTSFLAYDLHFAGLGDNQIISHSDWQLYGLERSDIIQELKGMSLERLLIVQAAGEAIRISWFCKNWEEYIDAIS